MRVNQRGDLSIAVICVVVRVVYNERGGMYDNVNCSKGGAYQA